MCPAQPALAAEEHSSNLISTVLPPNDLITVYVYRCMDQYGCCTLCRMLYLAPAYAGRGIADYTTVHLLHPVFGH